MRINEKLSVLPTLLMEQSWHPESMTVNRKRVELLEVKSYLDEHYMEKIVLDDFIFTSDFGVKNTPSSCATFLWIMEQSYIMQQHRKVMFH